MVEIKFCGMTRPEDARAAAAIGARYVGVILADGPRALTDAAARAVLDAVPETTATVGVFGSVSPEEVAMRATRLRLRVVQLHGDADADMVAQVRQRWTGQIWPVVRVAGSELPATASDLFDVADAVVLDSRVPGKLGGTGVSLPWDELSERIAGLRSRRAKLVLAGGLRPDNVARAVSALGPDVVDVSSGVESTTGVKDPDMMRAFRDAALHKQVR